MTSHPHGIAEVSISQNIRNQKIKNSHNSWFFKQ